MKKSFFTLLTILSMLLTFTACGDRVLGEDAIDQLNAESEIHDWLAFIENTDADLDAFGERFESLVFTNKEEETKSIFWYKGDTVRVIRHQIRNLLNNEQREISYYFGDKGLLLVQELIDVPVSEDEIQTTEYISIYEDEKPKRTWVNKWYGSFADPLQYKDTDLKSHNYQVCLDMFTLEGDFQVTFDNFLENDADVYLLVETIGKEHYIAALKIERMDDFLSTLYNDKVFYKRKKLNLDYQVVNESGWVFSYYRSGSLK